MKLTDYNNFDIKKNDNLSSKFQSIKGDNVNFTCNILNGSFYLDTHNYYPITDEMFTAERGKGSILNDKRIRIATRKKLSETILVTGIPHLGRGDKELFIKEMNKIIPEVAGIRRSGSAALDLAWIAAGRYDIFWERGLEIWDIAAGVLLVREAGGFAKGLDGSEKNLWEGNVIAGNDDIINALSEKLDF